jgi:DnaJ homolog subfamily B member 6
VFREFFGGSPFDDFFNQGQTRRHHQNGHHHAGGSRQHHHQRQHQQMMSPFLSFSLMDDMFAPHGFGMNSGFTSLSTFNNSSMVGNGIGGGGGNVKRISTSTSFINGKKVTTKK